MSGFERTTVEAPNKGVVTLHGGFATNGASNPATLFGNFIQSVTRTGAGAYLVQLKSEFIGLKLLARFADLTLAAAGDSRAQLGAYSASAGTLVVTTLTAGAAADIAAATDNYVFLTLEAAYLADLVQDGTLTYDS